MHSLLAVPDLLMQSRTKLFVSFMRSDDPAAFGWMAAISPDLPIPWPSLLVVTRQLLLLPTTLLKAPT